ncbi:peptide chain release factor PrfB3, chloroplastic-like isoform X2 [Raphanus sativus]|uniref:valine--tRNA ligase n=1 Tax=Raphanus sativus TaxID=3726 RepID=A0A9W3D229_RAPSA|nr:peptide chain release factor PrfB3, chloroplastic-like isoform X2 [Raphanus sativus]XP_056857852.1 peptide chain release factor PrfB3, chloroplastic-like isoform X2 [Raphanus sativus]
MAAKIIFGGCSWRRFSRNLDKRASSSRVLLFSVRSSHSMDDMDTVYKQLGLFSLKKKIKDVVLKAEMLAPAALELEEEQWIKQEETLRYCDLWDDPTKSDEIFLKLAARAKAVDTLKDLKYKVYSKASKKFKALEKAKLAAELKAKQGKDVSKKSTKKSSQRDAYEENPEDFMDPETPVGERKQLSLQMAKQYSPAAVDRAWYAWWEKAGFFTVDAKSSKPVFVIVLPPPNVNGLLHIGHALTTAIQTKYATPDVTVKE